MSRTSPASRGLPLAGAIVAASVAVAIVGAPPAKADSCDFQLSSPSLVTLKGGTVQVTASLAVKGCEGSGSVSMTKVCVTAPTVPGGCARANAFNSATVYTDPQAATRWISRGTGCYNYAPTFEVKCVDYGPISSTL